MIKSGVFQSAKTGQLYDVYELEEKNSYRLDICEFGAEFHNQPEKILFSLFRKRKTYIYGDRELYEELTQLRDTLINSNLEVHNENVWESGVFVMRQIRKRDEKMYMHREMINGRYQGEVFILDEANLQLKFYSDVIFDMNPLTLSEYETVEVVKDNTGIKSPYVPLSVLKSRYNLSWDKERKYLIVGDLETARAVLADAVASRQLVGFDYETDGLEFNLYSKNKMGGIVISPRRGESYYFPFRHEEFKNLPWSFTAEIEEAMQIIHNNSAYTQDDWWGAEGPVPGACAHNMLFEFKVSMKERLKIPIRHDSFILSKIIDPRSIRGLHSLKNLAYEITGLKFLEFEDVFIDKKNINFLQLPEEIVRIYACPDADNCCTVFETLWREKLPSYQRALYELEAQLVEIKASEEYWGFRINNKGFLEGYENAKKLHALLLKLIRVITRSEFKVTSNIELGDLLYNRMKAPIYLRTKSGAPSTSSSALRKLATIKLDKPLDIVKDDIRDSRGKQVIKKETLNQSKFPVVILLEKFKEVEKLITAFYGRIVKGSVGDLSGRDTSVVRYFSWFSQMGAESGRQSSPMHQLPKEIKQEVLSDSSEHNIAGTDYSQIELRLQFSLAKEEELIKMCEDPDNDVHRGIAGMIQNKEIWSISAKERQQDKARNFGVVYLISGMGLAAQKYGAGATKEQIKECEDSIREFFHHAKRVAAFIKNNQKIVLEHGQISTLFNRTRYFPRVFDPDVTSREISSIIRQANNLPVQGLGADLMKRAEVNIELWIKSKGWDKLVETPEGSYPLARQMISAHDEALVSYHKSIPVEEILEMKRDCMEMKIKDFAPLFVSTSIIDNWVEGKEDEYACPVRLRDKLIEDYKRTGVSICHGDDRSHKEIMAETIHNYLDAELRSYMEDLYSKTDGTAQKIAPLVRHPSLTHDLIARFPQTKEHLYENGYLNHEDHILYSVQRYLDERGKATADGGTIEEVEEVIEEVEAEDIIQSISGLRDELYEYNDEGEIIYTTAEDEEDEDGFFMYEDEEAMIHELSTGEKIRVWEMFDSIIIDTKGLTMPEVDKVLAHVYKDKDDKGFFTVQLMHNDKLVNTGIRVERADLEDWRNFITDITGTEILKN